MSYKIKVYYQTGNTFGSEETENYLRDQSNDYRGYVFEDRQTAIEVLKRLKEHYLWYESTNNRYKDEIEKPSWWTGPYGKWKSDWYFNGPGNVGEAIYDGSMYCGYFETLQGAEIVLDDESLDSDTSFTL